MLAVKKKKTKRILIISVTGLCILAIIAGVLLSGGTGVAMAQESVLSATALTGTISTTIVGTGNLSNSEAESVVIPSGLTVEEVLVESGDTVAQGDILAVFSADSVQSRIAEVQEQIDGLDEEIDDVKDDTESTTISSNVSGRVKAIYVGEGDSVTSAVLEHDAILVISLDGLMAVSFQTTSAAEAGDSVTVELSDGTEKTGAVQSNSGGVCVVTLSDNGPEYGEAVTVCDSDDNQIGSGSLYINKPLGITGTSGTIDTIHVSENSYVYSGTKLVTLSDTAVSSEYKSLMAQRNDAVETLKQLLTLAQTNTLTAEFDGTVESVGLSASGSSSSSSSNASDGMAGYISSSKSLSVTLLSNLDESAEIQEITDLSKLAITTPAAGAAPQTEITDASGRAYTGKIQWTPADEAFLAGTEYTAQVKLTPNEGYEFSAVLTDVTANKELFPAGGEISDIKLAEGSLTFNIKYTVAADTTGQTGGNTQQTPSGSTSSGSGGSSSYSSYSSSASSGSSASATASSDTDSSGSSSDTEVTAFTISENKSMSLSINVDELDILNVQVGQTATVTLDAIDDEIFTATVSKVNTTASSSGGVTRYTVDLSVPRSDRMLAGMTASATITIQEASGILVIPVAALQESVGRVFVYTGVGEDGATLTGEADVETGLSDGNYVEIVSGLSVGDVVYYSLTISADSAVLDQGNFVFSAGGGMTSGDSGEMPAFSQGDSDMPSRGQTN